MTMVEPRKLNDPDSCTAFVLCVCGGGGVRACVLVCMLVCVLVCVCVCASAMCVCVCVCVHESMCP